MNTVELGLVSTVDLIEALAARFDALVLNGMSYRTMETDTGRIDRVSAWRLKGDQYICIGLAEAVKDRALASLGDQTSKLGMEEL